MNKSTYELIEAYMLSCMEDSAHDKEHIYRVLYNALHIAKTEEQVDYDVLICACLLHDIGRKEQYENSELCHAAVGSEKAYSFLVENDFDCEYAEKVRRCICTHRYRKDNLPESIEAKILFDADKLDATGTMGIARTLLYKGIVSEPLYTLMQDGSVSSGENDINPSFFQEYKYKLEKLYSNFYTAEAKAIARERQEAAAAFYNSLLEESKFPYENGRDELEMILSEGNGTLIDKEKEITLPKMILFDYGQTLINEPVFDGIKGTEEVLKHAVKNKHHYTAEDVQAAANAINDELGRYDPARSHLLQIEVPNSMFSPYLYESMGIELTLSDKERDQIFWDAASPGVPTEGIQEFLDFLKKQGIRTGVISNISYCGEAVKERIDSVISGHDFEFVVATSEYLFRKPNKRIFELALEKADLNPEDVWYIGDNYDCDVVGARNAGMFPVWYVGAKEDRYIEKTDVLLVRKWADLQDRLGAILAVSNR